MKIEWNDSYKIGDTTVDTQHQHLFELTNDLISTDEIPALKLFIMKLYQHTREHFEAEEALMRKLNFPACTQHTEYHNRLLARLNEISAAIGRGQVDKPAIHTLMTDWALRHVQHDDGMLAAYIASE